MIQRIQTIYLLLAFSCTVLTLVFPQFSMTAISNEAPGEIAVTAEFGSNGLVILTEVNSLETSVLHYQAFDTLSDNPDAGKFPVYFLFIFLALLTFASFLAYKNRKTQLMFSRISLVFHILVVVGFLATYYLAVYFIKKEIPEAAPLTISFDLEAGLYLLIATIPFLILANRGIKNDEKLVKSLDRIR